MSLFNSLSNVCGDVFSFPASELRDLTVSFLLNNKSDKQLSEFIAKIYSQLNLTSTSTSQSDMIDAVCNVLQAESFEGETFKSLTTETSLNQIKGFFKSSTIGGKRRNKTRRRMHGGSLLIKDVLVYILTFLGGYLESGRGIGTNIFFVVICCMLMLTVVKNTR
jgi:hypothetical protein